MSTLRDVLDRFEVRIPEELIEFAQSRASVEEFSPIPSREMSTLEAFFPGMPFRTMPFLQSSSGDLICWHWFHRPDAGAICLYLGENSVLQRIAGDVEEWCRNPWVEGKKGASAAWEEHTVRSIDSRTGAREVLAAPLWLSENYVALEVERMIEAGTLEAVLGRAWRDQGLLAKAQAVKGDIPAELRDRKDLLDPEAWKAWGLRLANKGEPWAARRILENGKFVVLQQTCGVKEQWRQVSDFCRLLSCLFEEEGDMFDARISRHYVDWCKSV